MKKINIKEITCPFCSLLCDDINVIHDDKKYNVHNLKNKECSKKIEAFNINKKSILLPKIGNKISTFKDAINKSKLLIKAGNEIGILNLGADVASVRSAINLTSQINANFDHINSKYFFGNMNIVQRTGYIATTLMEVKNRSDVILIFGTKIFGKVPRLTEKILFPKSSLYIKKSKKKIFLVGQFPEKDIKKIKNNSQVTNINIKIEQIPEFISLINSKDGINNLNLSDNILNKVRLSLNKSKYATAIWSSSDFFKSQVSDIIISSITKFICDLNNRTRAVCLPISGNLGDSTSIQVSTWLTGFPVRFKGVNGIFKHDREAYDVTNLILNNQIDTAIYINTLSLEKIQLNKKIKNIVIGHPRTTCSLTPDVFIPVGVPGVDASGIMFRTDNVVTLPLSPFRQLNIPSSQQVLDKMV